ncbi:MAG: type II secretion system F family protein [Candidatus Micrarchaeota archaeon]
MAFASFPGLRLLGGRLPAHVAASCAAFISAYAAFGSVAPVAWLAAYSIAASAFLVPAFEGYRRSARVRELEKGLPMALFLMTSLPSGAPFEKMLLAGGGAGGEAGRAFARVEALMRRGLSAQEALAVVSAECGSREFARMAGVLSSVYSSGGMLSDAVVELANDSLELSQLARESQAMLSLQKYTIVAAAAVLVPFIIGSVFAMAQSLSLASADSAAAHKILPPFAFACQVYLLEFSAIASAFIAAGEGNIKKAALYCPIIAPVSLLAFHAAAGVLVLA